MRKIINLLIILTSVAIGNIAAQQPGGIVPDQSQDVIKNFDAKLLESEKIKINPVLPKVDTATKAQTYTVPNKVLGIDYQPPRMRPIALAQQKLPPQYNGYLKAGYGFPNSPYGEGAYRYGDPKQYLLGLSVKHHSAEDKKVENQRFSKTDVEATGTFYARAGVAVDAKLYNHNNSNYYYGYNAVSDSTFDREAVKQSIGIFGASIKAYNSVRTVADFNYGLGANFYSLGDNYSSKETDFNLKLEATKWFKEKHPLSMIVRTEFTSLDTTDSGKKQSLNNIYLQPSFTFKGVMYSLKIGANLISSSDIFYPKPDIEATLNLAGNKLGIFAGWRGDMTKNSYRNLVKYNPFMFSRPKIKNTEVDEIYGGVKGKLNALDYSAQFGWSNNKDLALFLSDSTDLKRRFNVIYDTVKIANIRAAITMNPVENLELTGTISQNVYTAKRQAAAWGLPSLDVNVSAKYKVFEDAKANTLANLKASLFVQNGVNYLNKNKQPDRLNPLFDLSVGGEVFFNKNIGVFLDANNLLNLKRERWQNYPTFGLNILGGVSARF